MKKIHRILAIILSVTLLLTCSGIASLAEGILTLPAALTVIDTEAFCGDTSISKVVLSDTVTEIRSRAFADSTLTEINLPDSLKSIADDALPPPSQVTVTANSGSDAYDWAVRKGYIEPELFIASLTMDAEELKAGDTARWTAAARYGTEPYKYQFILYKDTTKVKQSSYSTANTYSYTFTEEGTYHMVVKVRDDDYITAEYTGAEFTVGAGETGFRVTAQPDQESAYLHDNLSWTAQAEGGKAPYRYSFKLFVDGRQTESQGYSENNVFTTTADQAADYTLQVDVLDAENSGATFTTEPFTVGLAELKVTSFQANAAEALTEDTLRWDTQAAGGQDPYTYAYSLSLDGTVIETKAASEEEWYEYTALEPGTYTLTVTVYDQAGHSATAQAGCAVALRPVAVSGITAEAGTQLTGDTITWTVTAEGGDRNYTYAFTLLVDGEEMDGRSFTADNTYTYIPGEAGTYSIEATVRDGANRRAKLTGGETVISTRPLEIISVTADKDTVRAGSRVTLTTAARGGAGGRQYSFEVYDAAGMLITASKYNLSASYTYTPQAAGIYTFKALVKDEEETVVTATSSAVTVYDALTISGITASADSVLTGEGVTWTAERTGGRGIITYDWFIYRNGVLEYTERNTKGSVSWAPMLSGNYSARVSATDEDGDTQEATGGAVTSSVHEATPQEQFTFNVLNGSNCELISYNGSDSAVIIPEEWDDGIQPRTVQRIANGAFKDNQTITSVIIPDGVKTMDQEVFSGCSSLIYVKGGTSLTGIGNKAFYNCVNLRRYDFEPVTKTIGGSAFVGCNAITHFEGWDGLTTIGYEAFRGNQNLTAIDLVSTVKTINGGAFQNCRNLTSVTLPEGLLSINGYAFYGCTGLENIHLPDTITTLSADVFYGCSNLTEVNYPQSWTTKDWEGNYYNSSDGPFANCVKLTYIEIPERVKAIPSNAFYNTKSLTAIQLPSTLQTIGYSAFQGCIGLTSLDMSETGIKAIPSEAFRGCTGLTSVILPERLLSISGYAFQGCTSLESIHLPDNITTLSADVFYGCSSLTAVNYPRNWTTKDWEGSYHDSSDSPFAGCGQLRSIEIPEEVTAIPNNAFCNAASLNKIELPSTLQTIGYSAFQGCTGLTGVIDMPANVEALYERAYYGCINLTSIRMDQTKVTAIPSEAFRGCAGLRSVILPEGLQSISGYAFFGCTSLESIHLPDNITTMSADVFYGCSSLTAVNYPRRWTTKNWAGNYHNSSDSPFANCEQLSFIEIPEGVDAIPDYAFYNATYFNNIKLPSTLQTIGYSAFQGCERLTGAIDMPVNVEALYDRAYYGCKNLTSIRMDGTEVTAIPSEAFRGCAGLRSVILPERLQSISGYAFQGCTSLESIHLPDSITTLSADVFYGCSSLAVVNYPKSWTTKNSTGNYHSSSDSPFAGCAKLKTMNIPNGVTMIPANAFYGCGSITSMTIPGSVEQIGANAFGGLPSSLIIYGRAGSYAEEFARDHGYDFNPTYTTSSLSGSIAAGSTGIQGVAVTVYDATTADTVGTVYTLSDGSWAQDGLTKGHAYKAYYYSRQYSITPAYSAVNLTGGNYDIGTVQAVLPSGDASDSTVTAACGINSVETGEPVDFILSVNDATEVRLIVDGVIYETYLCGENGGTVRRAFHKAGNRSVRFQAGKDGNWGAFSNEIMLSVTNSHGSLTSAVVHMDEYCQAAQDAAASWEAVPYAEEYTAYVFVNGSSVYHETTTGTSMTIPANVLVYAGNYSLEVVATAHGYTQSSGSAFFKVVDKTLTVDTTGSRCAVGDTAVLKVTAPGADYIRADIQTPTGSTSRTRWGSYAEVELTMEEAGTHTVHISAGKNEDEAPYAAEDIEIEAYYGLQMSQIEWRPESSSETLEVTVTSGGEWEVAAASDWLAATRTEGGYTVSILSQDIANKAGYVQISSGNLTKSLYVYGPLTEEVVITSPGTDSVDNAGGCPILWNAVEDARNYYVMVRDETIGSYILLNYEATQAEGEMIPAAYLIDQHMYSVTVVAWRNNGMSELLGVKSFTVNASNPASITGSIITEDNIAAEDATIYVGTDDRYFYGVTANETGAYELTGLAPNSTYTVYVYDGSEMLGEKTVQVTTGIASGQDIIIDSPEIKLTGEIDIDEEEPYYLELHGTPEQITTSEEWLVVETTSTRKRGEADAYLKMLINSDAPKTPEAELNVTYTSGQTEKYKVYRSNTTSYNSQYLAPKTVQVETEYEFNEVWGGVESNGSGTINNVIVQKKKTVIKTGDTITVTDKGGLRVDNDLEINGKVILNPNAKLQAKKITVNGELIINSGSVSADNSMIIKGNGRVSISDKSKDSSFSNNAYICHELKLESNATLTVSSGYVVVSGNMYVKDNSAVIQSGGTINIYNSLTFDSNKQSTLSAGTIEVNDDAALKNGYLATSKNHELKLTNDPISWSWRKTFTFNKDKGQKIGYLYVKKVNRYKNLDKLTPDDIYESNITLSGVEFKLDLATLKASLVYTNSSLYSVTPYDGGDPLNDQQQTAIILEYLKAVCSGNGADIPETSFSVPDLVPKNKTFTAYYFNSRGYSESITFTIDSMITMRGIMSTKKGPLSISATSVVGTAWIIINGHRYTIHPTDNKAMTKMMQAMQTILIVNAARQLKKGVTTYVDSSKDFGKNGVISYLKKICSAVGINTDTITSVEAVKRGLEAESAKDFWDSVKTLIDIAKKY